MSDPKRIQRKRTKGWRSPSNTVYVGRPSKWGNPHACGVGSSASPHRSRIHVVEQFREYATSRVKWDLRWLDELRGKDLACWCPLNQPCHADVLLEIANSAVSPKQGL